MCLNLKLIFQSYGARRTQKALSNGTCSLDQKTGLWGACKLSVLGSSCREVEFYFTGPVLQRNHPFPVGVRIPLHASCWNSWVHAWVRDTQFWLWSSHTHAKTTISTYAPSRLALWGHFFFFCWCIDSAVEAEAPIYWPPKPTHWKRPWCWETLRTGGEGGNRGWDGWMASLSQWTWVWENSGRWWRMGKPGMVQSTGCKD